MTIAIEQVKLLGILITASALDQRKAKKADIEIDIGLHAPRQQRDVVNAAFEACRHALSPCRVRGIVLSPPARI